jgi:hypothetical protein
MHKGETLHLRGCFTQMKFIAGQTLPEIERRLGFRAGRLSQGAYVAQAGELPGLHGFNLMGYNQIPGDRFKTNGSYDQSKANAMYPGTDAVKLRQLVLSAWQLSGPDSLVKVLPVIPHTDRETYPPGSGVPQWEVTEPIRSRVIAEVEPYGRFSFV